MSVSGVSGSSGWTAALAAGRFDPTSPAGGAAGVPSPSAVQAEDQSPLFEIDRLSFADLDERSKAAMDEALSRFADRLDRFFDRDGAAAAAGMTGQELERFRDRLDKAIEQEDMGGAMRLLSQSFDFEGDGFGKALSGLVRQARDEFADNLRDRFSDVQFASSQTVQAAQQANGGEADQDLLAAAARDAAGAGRGAQATAAEAIDKAVEDAVSWLDMQTSQQMDSSRTLPGLEGAALSHGQGLLRNAVANTYAETGASVTAKSLDFLAGSVMGASGADALASRASTKPGTDFREGARQGGAGLSGLMEDARKFFVNALRSDLRGRELVEVKAAAAQSGSPDAAPAGAADPAPTAGSASGAEASQAPGRTSGSAAERTPSLTLAASFDFAASAAAAFSDAPLAAQNLHRRTTYPTFPWEKPATGQELHLVA